MEVENNLIFNAAAKWERNFLCHSPGHLQLSDSTVEFVPHRTMSVLGKHLRIPIGVIGTVQVGDNFLWRGVVHIILNQPVNHRTKYTFFLGTKRKNFILAFENIKENSN